MVIETESETEETEETEEIIDTSGAEKYYISIDDEESSWKPTYSEKKEDNIYFDEKGTRSSVDGKITIRFA